MKLFYRFSLSVLILLTIVIFGTGFMSLISEKRLLNSEMTKHHTEITQRLAKVCEESLFQDEVVLFNYIKGLENERGFHSACFLDTKGVVLVHSDPRKIGFRLKPIQQPAQPVSNVSKQVVHMEGQDIVQYETPVVYGTSYAGTALLSLKKSELDQFIHKSLVENFKRWIPISLISLFIGLIGALFLTRTLVRPIHTVIGRMKEVGEGRREPFPEVQRKDELGWMASELNNTIVKLKELDQLKGEFVSAVTHELRSPLTAIERFVSLILKGTYGPITNAQQDTLMTIKNNSVRLAQFVDDVLTTSKLESRRVEVYLESFDIRESVEEVRKLFLPIASEKNLDFKLNIPARKMNVWADRTMVHHILSNLVSNALKFTEKGMVSLEVLEKESKIEIIISDTGVGISDKDKERVFEKFYRSLSTAHKTKGTGLGLFIVKSFLAAQNGTIAINSNSQGIGTAVCISLPKHTTENRVNQT